VDYKGTMKTLVGEMTALKFDESLLPNQASGDEATTPYLVLLFPNILQTHVPAFRTAALDHYEEAAHNDGRFKNKPILQNWSHVARLKDFVHKSVVMVHTHKHTQHLHGCAQSYCSGSHILTSPHL
jgi:hypothetical protein